MALHSGVGRRCVVFSREQVTGTTAVSSAGWPQASPAT
jgi:hypothetical protein